jgi:hypothetical protein
VIKREKTRRFFIDPRRRGGVRHTRNKRYLLIAYLLEKVNKREREGEGEKECVRKRETHVKKLLNAAKRAAKGKIGAAK